MTTIYQTSEKNPTFSTIGNGQFGAVIRTGWKESRLGEGKRRIIINALSNSDTDKVYKRGKSIFRNLLNGTEQKIA